MAKRQNPPRILLTPGPVTTSARVKQSMLEDLGTWDRDYLALTEHGRHCLLALAASLEAPYTAVLFAGSGPSAGESVISRLPPGQLAVFANGTHGERMADIGRIHKIPATLVRQRDSQPVEVGMVRDALAPEPGIRYVGLVHGETTTGLLNPLHELAQAAKHEDRIVLVDAVSSFGGYPLPVGDWGIDVLMTATNKCLQGVPELGIVVAEKFMRSAEGQGRPLSLRLHNQWRTMNDRGGKWRYTSPTQSVQALKAAFLRATIATAPIKRRCRRRCAA